MRHPVSCILLLFIIISSGCIGQKNANKSLEVKAVIHGDINEVVSASGIVLSEKDQVTVTSKTIGTVDKIYFEENSQVKQGQILLELNKNDLLKQLEQAEASQRTAQIRLKQAETTVALQPEEINSKIAQAETAYITAQKQVEQVKIQLKAQEEQLEAKITEAELAVKAAQDNLTQLKNQSPLIEEEASSGLAQAKLAMNTTQTNYERQKSLYNQGFISKQDYEIADSQYQKALNEYNMAEQKVESVKIQNQQALLASENQVKQAEEALKLAKLTVEQQKSSAKKQMEVARSQEEQAHSALESTRGLSSQIVLRQQEAEAARVNVTQLQIGIEQIKDQLNNTSIKAPISGTVIKKQVTIGQGVLPTVPVAIIANLDTLIIQAMVDEGDVGKVKEKQKVHISSDNFPNEKFSGEVTMVASSASEAKTLENKASYKVTISITDTRGLLKMGMNTYNDIVVAQKKNVLIVPNTALHQSAGKNIVYISGGMEPVERVVQTGLSDNENTEIISGVSEGEKVISGGLVK